MKVLLAHNYYRSSAPSGEDTVFRNERVLLDRNGVEVIPYEVFNDDIDDSTMQRRVRVAMNTSWSKDAYRGVSEVILKTRPDVAHFHNTFPQLSPSVYAACRKHGVPVVQTLHNFRLVCPGALLLRKGEPCEDCLGSSLFPALLHHCYRGSLAATSALVWMLYRNRLNGSYRHSVDRYVALTNFAAARLVAGGLPADRVVVRPNFIPSTGYPGPGDGGYAVYVGRLSEEKGVRTLIAAWAYIDDVPLKVLGDGVLRGELEREVREKNLDVEFLGYRGREEVMTYVGRAMFQVVPSECYEGFPMAVLEAYASGTPVVASRLGSLDEIVAEGVSGVKFDPRNPVDLAAKIRRLVADKDCLSRLRQGARLTYEQHYTPGKSFRRLLEIYADAGVIKSRLPSDVVESSLPGGDHI